MDPVTVPALILLEPSPIEPVILDFFKRPVMVTEKSV
jgi:hypothetical protein